MKLKKMENKLPFINILIVILLTEIMFVSCKQNYTPKPMGYYRIEFPEHEYNRFSGDCPYSFEYPQYSDVQRTGKYATEPCWMNIVFPEFNGTIHLSYKNVDGNLEEMTEDARKLTYKHSIKAESINERVYADPEKNIYGVLFEVKGNAASALQFYITDSTNHFLRGALYFNVEPNKDSLAPVIEFFKQDIEHLMESVEWKK